MSSTVNRQVFIQHEKLRASSRLLVCNDRAVEERNCGGGGAHHYLIAPSTPLGPLVPPADTGPCVPVGPEYHLSRVRSAKLYGSSDSMLATTNHGTREMRLLHETITAQHSIPYLEFGVFRLDKPVVDSAPNPTPLTPTLTLASPPHPPLVSTIETLGRSS